MDQVIVKELTEEIITETLKAYSEDDAYWLKLYQFSDSIRDGRFEDLSDETLPTSNRESNLYHYILSILPDLRPTISVENK